MLVVSRRSSDYGMLAQQRQDASVFDLTVLSFSTCITDFGFFYGVLMTYRRKVFCTMLAFVVPTFGIAADFADVQAELDATISATGCLSFSLSTIKTDEADRDRFVKYVVSGIGNGRIHEMDLVLEVSSKIEAGVELCPEFDRAYVLEPVENGGSGGQQNMASVGVLEYRVNNGAWQLRSNGEIALQYGDKFEAKLNTFCLDPLRDAPERGAIYRFVGNLDEKLLNILSASDSDYSQFCLWEARSRSREFFVDAQREYKEIKFSSRFDRVSFYDKQESLGFALENDGNLIEFSEYMTLIREDFSRLCRGSTEATGARRN